MQNYHIKFNFGIRKGTAKSLKKMRLRSKIRRENVSINSIILFFILRVVN